MNFAYWIGTGWSRPRFLLIMASETGSQFLPQASRAGSAGRAKKRKNVIALIRIRITIAPRDRRARNLNMTSVIFR
ncbi:hypothetical protein SANTM175S_08456 [Streptomyces antimycoticus]